MRSLLCLSLTAALFLTGCGDDPAPGDASDRSAALVVGAAGSDGPNFFDRIDADSPYVFANLTRTPDALVDSMWAINEASAESNEAMLQALAEDEELPPEARALMTEMMALTTREGWEAAGLHVNPMYAFHGISLFPVAHLELADTDAFRAKLASVEASMESPLPRRDVDGTEIIWFELDAPLGIAIHIAEGVVSAGLVPDRPDMFGRITGTIDPAEPMDASTLAAFNREIGLTDFGSGYFDLREMLAHVLDADSVIAELDVDGELEAFRNDPACTSEFQALTNALPRMIAGYTRMDEDRADAMFRIETSDEIGRGLAPIAQAPVSIDRELSGLANLGVAIDLIAAREFARGLVNGWVENPPQCEAFRPIGQQALQMQDALNRPIPPVVTNIKGLFLEANSLEFGEGGLPTGGGTMSFFMKDPQLLVGMAQMFSPQVAELSLEPGGEAQKVPMEAIPQLAGSGLEAWMAMGKGAIGMAIGEDQIEGMTRGLDETEADAFLMAGRMDFDLLVDLMDFASQGIEAQGADPDAVQMLQTQREQYVRMAEYYDQGAFRIGLSEDGIDIVFEARMEN